MHRLHTLRLENGLAVILVPLEATTVTVGCAVRGGDRLNPPQYPDLAHGLEHQMIRATKLHPNEGELARYCDEFSDGLDGETDETSILIWINTLPRYALKGVALMREIVFEPLPSVEHVRPEKERLRHEFKVTRDSRSTTLWNLFDDAMFRKNGVEGGWIVPDEGDDHSYSRYLFFLHKRLFVGQRSVIVIAGKFDPGAAEDAIRNAFTSLPTGQEADFTHHDYTLFKRATVVTRDETECVNFILGFPAFGFPHPDRIALGVLRNHLSAKESSRLKLRLDGAGLCYDSEDHLWFWPDIGQYAVEASPSRENFLPALEIIGEEISTLREKLLSRKDLAHAKCNVAVNAQLKFDSPREAFKFYAKQWVNLGEAVPLPIYLRKVRRVTPYDIRRVAREIFVKKRMVLVANGPLHGVKKKDITRALTFRRRTG